MTETIDTLIRQMEAAALAQDYEEAKRLRDMISLMRGGATFEEAAAADVTGLDRPKPGAMGLGTSQQRMAPPLGWTRPHKPDPMTTGQSSRPGGRK